MFKKEIYKIGNNLGLDKKEVDIVLNTPHTISNFTPTADIYKNGTDYGTISIKDIYKVGTRYGTVCIYDF